MHVPQTRLTQRWASRRPAIDLYDSRLGRSLILGLLCLLLVMPLAAKPPQLQGRVVDPGGQGLADVEILVVPNVPKTISNSVPLASAITDAAGRFVVAQIDPGLYRVAALKRGYRTYIGAVDIKAHRLLQLVLHPSRAHDDRIELPEDSSWVLRVPRSTVFRESEPTAVDAVDHPEAQPDGVWGQRLQVEVEQRFAAETAGVDDDRRKAPSMEGTQTRVDVSHPLGERGFLRLHGHREALDINDSEPDTNHAAHREASQLAVGFTYDTGPDTQVAMQAFFHQRDTALGAPALFPHDAQRVEQAWGYASEWLKQLDSRSRLALQMEFQDSSVVRSETSLDDAGLWSTADGSRWFSRWLGASGSYQRLATRDHAMEVGFEANVIQSPWIADHADLTDEVSMALQLRAQDSWTLAEPFTLTYGLGFEQQTRTGDSQRVIPRLGGTWSADRVVVEFMVSYPAWTRRDRPSAGQRPGAIAAEREGARVADSDHRVGYEAAVELPLGERLSLKGSTRYDPVRLDAPTGIPGFLDTDPTRSYVSAGYAAVGETTLSLVQKLGDAKTYLELGSGHAEGWVASALPQMGRLRDPHPGNVSFDNGLWGMTVVPYGTDVQVEYRRVTETGASQGNPGQAAATTEQESFELRLAQDLVRLPILGDWRFLMALRMATSQSDNNDALLALENGGNPTRYHDTLDRGVSAGLSVKF